MIRFVAFILAFSTTVTVWSKDVLVQLKIGSIPSRVFEPYRSEMLHYSCLSRYMNIWKLHLADEVNINPFIDRLRTNGNIVLVQENYLLERRGQTFPNDFVDWPMHNTGQSGGTPDADIDAPEAWSITQGGVNSSGDTVVIAVVDELFNLFSGDVDYWINRQEIAGNGIDDDNNGYVDDRHGWDAFADSAVTPGLGHGHYVASTLGEIGNNNTGSTGLMWRVKVMAVDVFSGYPDMATLVVAYDYILQQRMLYDSTSGQKGAYVVATNNSIGASGDGSIWNALIDSLGVHGILSMGATLNSPDDVEIAGDLPTELPSDYLISVTVSDHNDNIGNTGYGRISIDVAAPSASGFTSFGTPYVTALVGLLHTAACSTFTAGYKANPAQGARRIRELILAAAEPKPGFYGLTVTEGRINADRSLRALMAADCGSTTYPPVVQVQASARGVCAGNSVTFGAQQFGAITSWNWSFPGGIPGNSTSSTPVVLYNTSGDYSVTVIIGNAGGYDTLLLSDYIHVEPSLTTGLLTPFKEDFNSATILATTVDPDNDTLQWEPATQLLCDSGAYVCRNFDFDRRQTIDDLIFQIDLRLVDSVKLTFDYAYGGWAPWSRDRMQVIVRLCGQEIVLFDQTGIQLETVANLPSWTAFIPTGCADWKSEILSLDAFKGNNIELIFRNQNNYGNNLYLDNIELMTTQASVAVEEQNGMTAIQLFPNPANEQVTIILDPFSPANYELMDMQGRIVTKGELCNTTSQLQLTDYREGIYFLRIIQGKTVYTKRILILGE